ncbi:hypothetical protein CALVIDRAFT_101167 [Calocera viscosa TUFC12733]|uniref:Uncharacterized protein n=1 Tax=Calocera viscosa (strain TUFC12733) TaxID=1330018 RepID=A0A167MLX0_CALVF|nr:hypothetical protein CALVIDRAFT_101167 [Calocera viscosa TUFC12733]
MPPLTATAHQSKASILASASRCSFPLSSLPYPAHNPVEGTRRVESLATDGGRARCRPPGPGRIAGRSKPAAAKNVRLVEGVMSTPGLACSCLTTTTTLRAEPASRTGNSLFPKHLIPRRAPSPSSTHAQTLAHTQCAIAGSSFSPKAAAPAGARIHARGFDAGCWMLHCG